MAARSRTDETATRRRFGVGHVALLAGWMALAVRAGGLVTDNSFLWHIRAGSEQLARNAVLTDDPFSFTVAGEPWRTQSWLAELGYARLEAWFDLGFVNPMMLAIGAITLFALGLVAFSYEKRAFAVATYLVMAVVVIVGFFNPRPVVLGFVLFPLLMLSERDVRLRWTVPLIMWIWASVHGSFAIGGLYLLLRLLRKPTGRKAVMVAIAGGSTLLTAHGWGVVETLSRFARSGETLDVMIEWRTPDLLSPPFIPVLLGLFLLIAAGHRGVLERRDAWIIVPYMVVMFSAGRSVPLAWLALTPYLLSGLGVIPFPAGLAGRSVSKPSVLLAGALVVLPVLVPQETGLSEEWFPVAAMKYATGERLLHDDGAGGYIIYALWPDRHVFVDDRAELYGLRLNEFQRVRGGSSEWSEVFERDRIDEALLEPDDALVETLRLAGWREWYRDERWVLMRP